MFLALISHAAPGRELVHQLRSDADSGFTNKDESHLTLDQVSWLRRLEACIDELAAKVDRVQVSQGSREKVKGRGSSRLMYSS